MTNPNLVQSPGPKPSGPTAEAAAQAEFNQLPPKVSEKAQQIQNEEAKIFKLLLINAINPDGLASARENLTKISKKNVIVDPDTHRD